jgi:hypothetical protein
MKYSRYVMNAEETGRKLLTFKSGAEEWCVPGVCLVWQIRSQ